MLGRRQLAGLVGSLLIVASCGGTTRNRAGQDVGGAGAAAPGQAGTGAVATAGTGSSAGSAAVDPPLSCPELDCVDRNGPFWHPGVLPVYPADECPHCERVSSCEFTRCSYFMDTLGQPQPLPPELDCPIGYEVGVAPGACCFDCVRTQEPLHPICEGCLEPATTCPPGYRLQDRPGVCCQVCVADPNYCVTDADCLLAKRPANCCNCTLAISTRLFDEDPCYVDPRGPRPTPPGCQPDHDCSLIDCGCPSPPTRAACVASHCTPQ